jgi:hypothetical protein
MSRLDNDAKSHFFQFKLPVIQPPFSYPSIFIRLSFGTATVKRLEASGPKYCFTILKDLKEERAIPQKKKTHTRMQEVQMSTLGVIEHAGTHQTCWH